MTNKKKLILKISCILLFVLILCTFISRTIYTMMIPQVKADGVISGTIDTSISTTATFGNTNLIALKATQQLVVSDIIVKEGQQISKGDVLLSFDIDDANIATKRLELNILQLQNQLKDPISKSTKAELERKIEIAQDNLTLYQNGVSYDVYFEEEKLKQDIQDIEKMIKQGTLSTGDEASLKNKLTIAQEHLKLFELQHPIKTRVEKEQLELDILQLQNQLDSSTSETEKAEIRKKLTIAQDSLILYQNGIAYDVRFEEETLKQNIQDIQKLITQGALTTEDEASLKSKLTIAQEHLKLFEIQYPIKTRVEKEQLELAVTELKNQLSGTDISEGKKKEINLQLEIAKLELESYKSAASGLVKSDTDGVVAKLLIGNGESVAKGQLIAQIKTPQSKKCLNWSLSYEAGTDFTVGSDVNASFTIETKSSPTSEFSLKEIVSEVTTVSERKYDEENNKYIFTAILKEERAVSEGEVANIKLNKSSPVYTTIIPTSCLMAEPDGKYSLLLVESRQGFFSKQNYLKKINVEVLQKNNIKAAIKCDALGLNPRVLKYTSKPAADGDVISVVV